MSNNRPVRIALSGKSGCGNTTTSEKLAQRLGVQLINYTFRNLAEDEGMSFDELCQLAETDPQWDYLVDKRQIERANSAPSILGSRLAIWLWKEADLRVYLDAPNEVRGARIQKREGGDLAQVMEKTRRRDERDHNRYQRLYNIDNNNYAFADLIIDTSKHTPDEIVEIIVQKYLDKVR